VSEPSTPPPAPAKPAPETPLSAPKGPEWTRSWNGDPIPEKYHRDTLEETLAEVNKARGALEREFGRRAPRQDAPSSLAINNDPPVDPGDLDVDQIIERSGLRQEELAAQVSKFGKLDPEQIAAIRKVNPSLTPKIISHIAEAYALKIEASARLTETVRSEGEKIAGGPEQLATLMQWAKANLDPASIARYDRMTQSDPRMFPSVVRLLMTDHAAAIGSGQSRPLAGAPRSGGGAAAPSNVAEMRSLMDRVRSGDRAAIQTLNDMDPSEIRSLT